MRIVKEITLGVSANAPIVRFGIPTTSSELESMFHLRHDVYVSEKKYIPAGYYPESLDKDYHDTNNECIYFIAMVNGVVIGTARILHTHPLPIFQDYFAFDEPLSMQHISEKQKVEIGRIISRHRHVGVSIPRQLVMLGIFSIMADYGEDAGFDGGYGAIKSSALRKFERIGVPIHRIPIFQRIYSPSASADPLKRFFDDGDLPVPVFYLRDEIKLYCDAFFSIPLFFTQQGFSRYCYLNPPMTLLTTLRLFLIRRQIKKKLYRSFLSHAR